MHNRLKLAIVGTQGLPNQYGGFETLVDYLAKHLSQEYDITVYCSAKDYKDRIDQVYGCRLIYLPFHANGAQSIIYDIISILKSVRKHDKILILGASGGIILPLLRLYKNKFILNFGGLDWKRSKWGRCARTFLKISEALAVKNSHTVISDNVGIQEYIRQTYKRESMLIEYGGDQVSKETINSSDIQKYPFLEREYAFTVARIQSDNNIEMILEAFEDGVKYPIVFVGNWKGSTYGREIKQKYSGYDNMVLLDAIYDQKELNKLRGNCSVYIHGHSAGGTNPSLVEAMNLSLPIFCYASDFNEYTTENKALYFSNKEQLRRLLGTTSKETLQILADNMHLIAYNRYRWETITGKYASCIKQ